MKMNRSLFVLISFIAILLVACSDSENQPAVPQAISGDISKINYFATKKYTVRGRVFPPIDGSVIEAVGNYIVDCSNTIKKINVTKAVSPNGEYSFDIFVNEASGINNAIARDCDPSYMKNISLRWRWSTGSIDYVLGPIIVDKRLGEYYKNISLFEDKDKISPLTAITLSNSYMLFFDRVGGKKLNKDVYDIDSDIYIAFSMASRNSYVTCEISWGDGVMTDVQNCVNPSNGEMFVSHKVYHKYTKAGNYQIEVRAKEILGPDSYLTVASLTRNIKVESGAHAILTDSGETTLGDFYHFNIKLENDVRHDALCRLIVEYPLGVAIYNGTFRPCSAAYDQEIHSESFMLTRGSDLVSGQRARSHNLTTDYGQVPAPSPAPDIVEQYWSRDNASWHIFATLQVIDDTGTYTQAYSIVKALPKYIVEISRMDVEKISETSNALHVRVYSSGSPVDRFSTPVYPREITCRLYRDDKLLSQWDYAKNGGICGGVVDDMILRSELKDTYRYRYEITSTYYDPAGFEDLVDVKDRYATVFFAGYSQVSYTCIYYENGMPKYDCSTNIDMSPRPGKIVPGTYRIAVQATNGWLTGSDCMPEVETITLRSLQQRDIKVKCRN